MMGCSLQRVADQRTSAATVVPGLGGTATVRSLSTPKVGFRVGRTDLVAMVSEPYHYPPDVFNLLVDTIPLLCKSKRDVLIFLRGAGVSDGDLAEVDLIVETDKASITKR